MSERTVTSESGPTSSSGTVADGPVTTDASALSTVLAIALSDLRQRSRSPKYLAVALLVAYVAQSLTAGDAQLFVGGEYTGVPNAAWFGGFTAVAGTTLLVLAGFSLVRGPITRDRKHSLSPLLATSPVSNATYLVGRWLGYFLVLVAVVTALAVATTVGFFLHGTGPFDPVALFTPFLVISLPTMALVAAVAVCFEAIAPLGRTLGAAIYVFGALFAISVAAVSPVPGTDFLGVRLVRESMLGDVPETVTGLKRLSFRIAPPEQATTFTWHGMDWGVVELATRVPILAGAAAILGVATLVFDRFRTDAGLAGLFRHGSGLLARIRGGAESETQPGESTEHQATAIVGSGHDGTVTAGIERGGAVTGATAFESGPSDAFAAALERLGRVGSTTPRVLDPRVLFAEGRLALRGHRLLWYVALAGLLIAQAVASLHTVRELLVPVSLLLPLAVWSGLGVRERRHGTEALVFTAPRPGGQTLAVWLGGVAVGFLSVAGAGVRLGLAGQANALAALLVGVAAMPALALAAGAWIGSARAFDTTYLIAWYLGPLQAVPPLDFVGAHSVLGVRTVAYGVLAVACLGAAQVGRRRP